MGAFWWWKVVASNEMAWKAWKVWKVSKVLRLLSGEMKIENGVCVCEEEKAVMGFAEVDA